MALSSMIFVGNVFCMISSQFKDFVITKDTHNKYLQKHNDKANLKLKQDILGVQRFIIEASE